MSRFDAVRNRKKDDDKPAITSTQRTDVFSSVRNRPANLSPYSPPSGISANDLKQEQLSMMNQQPSRAPALIKPSTTPETPAATTQKRFPVLTQIANFFEGGGDTGGLGLFQEAQRRVNSILESQGKMTSQEAKQIESDREARSQTGAYKAGEIAGYLPLGGLIERGVATAAKPALQNLPRTGRLATTGAAAGLIEGAAQEGADVAFRNGTFDPLNVALGGAIGGAAGAATPLVERTLSTAGSAIMKRLGERGKVAVPRALEEVIGPTTARIESRPGLDRVLEEIKPIVDQELTPPLENSKELAKWIQKNMGDDISLNEIRKLTYDDMVEIAGELRKQLSTYDAAVRVAKERGHDLEKLLNNKREITPDMVRRARELQRMREVSGVGMPVRSASEITPPTPEPAPKQDWFTRLFGEQNVGISAFKSNKGNRMVTTEQQIVSNPLRQTAQGLKDNAKQTARATYQNTVDMLSPLKTINRETYDAAMDAARANNLANTIVRDKFVDNQGNVIGKSLDEIMKNSRGLGKKVDDYLVLRHAITRMRRGERVYDEALQMTPERAEKLVRDLETRYPQLRTIGQEWDQFNTNLLDSGVREGLISQEARDAMRAKNPNYASMRRQFSVGEKLSQPKWSGAGAFSGQKAPIKEVSPTGSTRKIVSPLRSALEQTYAWKNAELRNRTMQEIVKAIQQDPQGMKGIVEIVKKPSTSYRSLDDALREGGSDEFLELLDNDFKSLFKKNVAGDENIVRAMVNGKPVYVKVHNPEAVKALLGLGSEQAGIVLNAMQFLSDATKRGATGMLAPMFAVKSLSADAVQAAIQSPQTMKFIAVDMPYALMSSIADALRIPGLRNLAQEFRRAGGEYSALLRGDRRLNTSVSSLRREPFLTPKGMAKGLVGTVKAPFKALERISDIAENAPRMAAYRRAMVGKERTPENVRAAINAARESTVNFSRKGAFARETEAFAPYSNAATQGLYRIARAFYKNPVKTLAGVTTFVVIPKLMEYAMFNDDPDYQKLPARERYRHLIIGKNSDGTFNKVFMPPEYLAMGSFVQDVLNDVINKDPEAYKGTLDSVVNAYTPPLVSGALQGVTQGGGPEQSIVGTFNSSVLSPAFAVAANQSFTGAPIVPQRLSGRSPGLQYDERTSAPAKWIGERIGMSPMKVDYLIRSYGGDPARLLLPLTSNVGAGTPRNTLLRNFIVDPEFTNTLSDDFYTAKERLTQAKSDFADAGKPLPDWYSEDLYKLVNSRAKNAASTKLSDLNAKKREINGNRTLSAEEKSRQLRDVQAKINEIYVDVNSQLSQAGVPMPRR